MTEKEMTEQIVPACEHRHEGTCGCPEDRCALRNGERKQERPDPLKIPTAAWLLHQLSATGEDAGIDFDDSDAIDGYFGWSVTVITNAVTGTIRRRELEVWWEPAEEDLPQGEKPKRHIRRFLIEEITGRRGAVTEEID